MLHDTEHCDCTRDIPKSKLHVPHYCEHKNLYLYTKALSRKTKTRRAALGRSRRVESKAEKRAREEFNETVTAWPCLFSETRRGHVCDGRLDAHHLVPKQFIRTRFSTLPEPDLLAILFHPHIGAPLCRVAHEQVTRRSEYVYWHELSEECLELVGSLPDFMLLRLEAESPKRKLPSSPDLPTNNGEAALTGSQKASNP